MRRHRVAACVLCPTYGNPLGHCMPDEKKKRLAALLERAGVPLVEDDVYGDLIVRVSAARRRSRPSTTAGNVLLCSSFSKTLAPGLRVGWAAPGRYRRAVERLKFNSMLAVPTRDADRGRRLPRRGRLRPPPAPAAARLRRSGGAHQRRGVAVVPAGHAREPPARRLRAVGGAPRRLRRAASLRAGARRADRDRARPDLLRHRALPELLSAGRRRRRGRPPSSARWSDWASWSASRCRRGCVLS